MDCRRALRVMLLIVPAFLIWVKPVAAQADDSTVFQISVEPSDVEVRTPPDKWLEAYLEDPDYQYLQAAPPSPTWWDQLKAWFWNWLSDLFDSSQQDRIWLRVFQGLAILIVLYAIVRYLKMDARGLFSMQGRSNVLRLDTDIEELRNTDFRSQAETAFNAGEAREAARLYYMYVLQVLDEKEAIDWMPQKTNQDYLHECRLLDFKSSFSRLTYLFDYIWYGDFPVKPAYVEEMRSLALGLDKTEGVVG